MHREIARTIRSLSPSMQQGLTRGDWELIVVDNGSKAVPDPDRYESFGASIRWLRVTDGGESPARAMNAGIAAARADLIGAMVDGARLASPGLLCGAAGAARNSTRPVVATLGYHLGPSTQQLSVLEGYDEDAEDSLLADADWTRDGYRLFDISTLAESSRGGSGALPAESNALFLSRELWTELGGFDEAFASPGGGLVNHDLLIRACGLPATDVFLLANEGTFHQVHGGTSTNSPDSRWDEFAAEYAQIRGRPWAQPDVPFTVI